MDAVGTLKLSAMAAPLLLALAASAQPTPADFVTSAGNPQPMESALAGIGETSVDQFNGEFTYSVPIFLPKYRGVEPHVALAYHSGGKNGPLGPGWGVTGFSSILRVGANHKTPDLLSTDSTDVYLLDGMELIPCSLAGNNTSTRAGPVVPDPKLSPSCKVGGTHATRLENYKRIFFNGFTWAVTERDGTVATYTPQDGRPTFWGRTVEASARGTVNYTWQCESTDSAAAACIPGGITYGPTAVTFHSTARSDHGLSFANGTPTLGVSTRLYRSIEVIVDGAHAAAYNLTYDADPASATSLLSGIQRFGKDYVLDTATQQVTGTPQPPVRFSYSQLSPFVSASVRRGNWVPSAADSIHFGDFNGDGKVDFLIQSFLGPNLALFLATGTPSFPFSLPQMLFTGGTGGWVVNSGGAGKDVITTGDFDGDGRTDFMIVNSATLPRESKAAIFYEEKESPYFSAPQPLWGNATTPSFLGWPCAPSGDSYVPGDFDGDGRTDLLFNGSKALASDQNKPNAWVMWASGNRSAPFSSSQPLWGPSGPSGATTGYYLGWVLNSSGYFGPAGCNAAKSTIETRFQIGDFDGDGKTDLALTGVWSNCTTATTSKQYYFQLLNATGDHAAPFAAGWAWTLSGHPFLTVGDFNGDGKTDLLTQADISNSSDIVVRFSTGNGVGFVPGPDLTKLNTDNPSCSSGAWSPWSFREPGPCGDLISVGDFNGDGGADLLVYNRSQLGKRTGIIFGGGNPAVIGANGIFSKALTTLPTLPAPAGVFIGDFNGDGRSDILDHGSWSVILSQGTKPMLLETIENGIGGKTRIAYSPSSGWPSFKEKVLPFVVQTVTQVSTTDGRAPDYPTGASQPVWHTRNYSYDTGAWDPVSRRFLGFGNSDSWDTPCVSTPPPGLSGGACPYTSTSYLHDLGGYSKPYQMVTGVQDVVGNRRLYGITTLNYTFSTGASGPYQSLVTSEFHEEYDGSIAPMVASIVVGCNFFPCASGRRTLTTYSYDNLNTSAASPAYTSGYGNLVKVADYGEADISGDERTTTKEYYPNAGTATGPFIVSLPAREIVFGPTGAVLREKRNFYDYSEGSSFNAISGSTAYQTPPTSGAFGANGFLTASHLWVDKWRPNLDRTTPFSSRWVQRRWHYDSNGNLDWTIDDNGGQISFAYDDAYHVYLTSITNALGQVTAIPSFGGWHKQCDKVRIVQDANLQLSFTIYDALCRPGLSAAPAVSRSAGITRYSYCGIGLESNQCGALSIAGAQHVRIETPSADGLTPQWTELYYDGLGRTYRTLTKGPEARPIGGFSVHDALGRVSYHSAPAYIGDALYWTRTDHDALGRVTSTVLPDGATATASYDFATCSAQAPGATCSRTILRDPLYSDSDPQSHISIALANARGHTVSATDPRGTTTYGYDVDGRLLSIVDEAGNQSKYTPDSLGRNVVIQDADLGTWNYRFDGLGNPLEQMDAIGQSTILTYDALNRRRTKTTSASAATRATWTYDEPRSGYFNIGRMTSATYSPGGGPDVSDQSNYDARGRLQLWQRDVGASAAAPFAAGFTVSHSYDDGNRLIGSTSTVAVDGVTISTDSFGPVSFDGAARPFSVPGIVQSASYDAAGHLLTRANANGTALTNTFSPTRGWLDTRSTSGSNGLLQSLDYRDRDAEGKVRSAVNGLTGQTWLYSYDGADRLYNAKTSCGTEPKSAFYVYDAVDNILDRYMLSHGEYRKDHYVYGDARHPHAVTSVGALSYSYDENGSMKQAPSYFVNGNGVIAPGANVSIEYDGFNHMVRRGSDVYAYDMNGDRVLENGRVFASDGLFVARDAVSGGYSVTSYYSFGGEKAAKRVSGATSGTGLFWLQSDLLGSVTRETDGSGSPGAYGDEQDYFPYGTPSWTNKPEAFGFTGQQQSPTTGIVYLHARYYDPFIGRFMAADTASPLERGVGVNRYAYMMNNPLGGSDPSGHGSPGAGTGDFLGLLTFLSSPSTNPLQEQIKGEMRGAVELEVKAAAVGVGVAAAAPFAAAGVTEAVAASGIGTLAYSNFVAPFVAAAQTLWQTGKDVLISGLRTGLGVNFNRISETILEPLAAMAEDRFASGTDIALGTKKSGVVDWATSRGIAYHTEWERLGLMDKGLEGWGKAFKQAMDRTIGAGG
jgi:RHS repeat-associated protein